MAECMRTGEEMIFLHQTFKNSTEVLEKLGTKAFEKGYVDETFLPALIEREENFPTGLEFPISISISHIEKGVQSSFVSVATLDEPVMFKSMDLSGDELQVRVAFVFGIKNASDQVGVLSAFARAFSNEEAIKELLSMNDRKEFLDKLNSLMDNMLCIEG